MASADSRVILESSPGNSGGRRRSSIAALAAAIATAVALLFAAPVRLTGQASAPAQDWPQWGGPNRNFQVEARGLAATWPPGGPKQAWKRPLGMGHSSILYETVGGAGRLYTMYRNGAREFLIALDAATGKTIWEHGFDAPYPARMQMQYGDGPHATPLITGNLICGTGTTARMHCVERATGKAAWSHDLWSEFEGSFIGVGYSSSPIAWRDLIIVQVGGPGASLVAFRRADGSVAWRAHSFRNSSSSPILIRVGRGAEQQEQLVAYMHQEVIGVNPADGALLWRHPIRAAGSAWNFHFNISTPVWTAEASGEGLLFVSTAYGIGGRALRLRRAGGATDVEELWSSERTRIHKETAIRLGDTVYASTGHLGPAFMTAMDVRSGRVLWQDRGFSHANLVWTGERFIILDEDGTLALASPGASGMNVHAKTELFPSTSWTVPTLVGTRLYARNRTHIVALELGR